ncbi:MAG: Gfo/Idh/MocA family protein [Planctomycetaceae bacterium]
MASLGIGMVGSGFMGLTYSEVLAKHIPGAHLAAVTGGKRAAALAADYGVPHAATYEELLARPDVAGVVLATPDQNRLELTRAAAAAGKHVLAEKPMAPTVAECDAMIAACQSAGVNLAVVQTERFRKITLKAKEIIDSGKLGPLWMLRTISSFPISLAKELFESRPWMLDPKGGGLFMGIASHNTDFLRWLTGSNATQVFAQVHSYSDLEAPAQSVMAQIGFESGAMAHMWISSEFPAPGWPSSEVRFQVVGKHGMLDLENFEYLDVSLGETWERIMTPERFDYLKEPKSPIRLFPHIGVVHEFVDSIREGRPPKVGGAEGRAAVELCEACLLSARTNQVVRLPLK